MKELTTKTRPNNYISFVQWDKRTIGMHRELVKKNANAVHILDLFVEHMDNKNAVMCSYQTLIELTGLSRSTVGLAMKVLKADRWIQVIKVGNASAYLVNSAAFWQTSAELKQYSKFSATIIASGTEQDKETIELKTKDLKEIPIVRLNEVLIEHDK